ncbi:hypothetical protein E2C01_074779 [Portunus trituberculatus]|uniref:Uncharacterized protein n=1 Tax=Portunus trituberculatus TaxID=210409 RepID=A0A5B7IF61_PORTR|nr:hypothetical protein [Portunus trituberculatus]
MVTSCVIFALELLYTSQRTDHIPPQVMHDNVEFMIPSRPMKEMAMDNRIFFVRTQGKNRKPWRMTGSERRRL